MELPTKDAPAAGDEESREDSEESADEGGEGDEFSTTCAVHRIVRVGGCCLAVVAQWQSTGGSTQRCHGFDCQPFHFCRLKGVRAQGGVLLSPTRFELITLELKSNMIPYHHED